MNKHDRGTETGLFPESYRNVLVEHFDAGSLPQTLACLKFSWYLAVD